MRAISRPVAKRPDKHQRRERWPEDLAVEQEVIEPLEVRENPEFRVFTPYGQVAKSRTAEGTGRSNAGRRYGWVVYQLPTPATYESPLVSSVNVAAIEDWVLVSTIYSRPAPAPVVTYVHPVSPAVLLPTGQK